MPRLPLPRRLLAVPAALALFGGGYFAGQHHPAQPADAQFGDDYCSYSTSTEMLSGLSGGTYTQVVGVVAHWNGYWQRWESVSDYSAKSALSGFSCQRR